MLTFEDFISENLMWQQSLGTKIFDVNQASAIGFNAFWMPMSSSIMRRIWPKEVRATVFHVTDIVGYRKIKKMQGKKGGISTFFEMRSSYFEQGIQTKGGIVLELDANVLGAFNQDVMSAPDRSGRRWIQLEFMKGRFGERDLNKYSKGLQDLVGNILNKYWQKVMNVSSTPRFQIGSYWKHWMNLGMKARQGQKKTLHLIIKDYIDGIESIYKKNEQHLRDLLTSHLKKRRTDEAWDEIIANNFKIKKVWVLSYSKTWGDPKNRMDKDLEGMVGQGSGESEEKTNLEYFMDEVKKDGFKVEDTDSSELEMYTRKVAIKETGQKSDQQKADDEFSKRQAEVLKSIGKMGWK
jgi:hypothetical protein